MTERTVLGVGLALGLAVGFATSAAPETEQPAAIRVFQFQPAALVVRPGGRVTWRNEDDIMHTVTSGAPGQPDGRFDIQLAGKGAWGDAVFPDPGTYPYFCARHPSMRGEVVVR